MAAAPTLIHEILLGAVPSPDSAPQQFRVAGDVLDEQLAALHEFFIDARSRLLEAKAAVSTHLAAVKFDLSTLPREILSNIFVFSLDGDASPSASKSPLVLLCVCRLWRDVALGTPQLWTEVKWKLSEENSGGMRPEHLAAWVARAGSLALSLTIVVPDGHPEGENPTLLPKLSELLKKSVVAHLDTAIALALLFDASARSAPFFATLQSLRARVTTDTLNLLVSCAALNHLSLLPTRTTFGESAVFSLLKPLKMVFGRLASLEIGDCISYGDLGDILQNCPLLLALGVSLHHPEVAQDDSILEYGTHESLLALRLAFEDGEASRSRTESLRHLEFPQLQSLTLDIDYGCSETLATMLEESLCPAILSRSPRLQHLSWNFSAYEPDVKDRGVCSTEAFLLAIERCDNVTTFVARFSQRIALALLFDALNEQENIFPRLKTVIVNLEEGGFHGDGIVGVPFEWEPVLDFISAHQPHLRAFHLHLNEWRQDNSAFESVMTGSRVQKFVAAGLDFVLVEEGADRYEGGTWPESAA
ncbi:F-box domain-containing protein [Mycena chlorophos]|uniref:F-box domain-containing protein n=1 Tax=Mycena chlorophos TaxID=658473 RepID=A0A8H6VX28_MYCCL|nr:F-box domain-containing protein [Mycena chlorophos]